jgi:hypothetical protein
VWNKEIHYLLEDKIYRTIILPVVLYGCETQLLPSRKERRLRVFENRVLRRLFGPKRDEVTGEWIKLHNEKLNDPYSFSTIFWGDQIKKNEMGGVCSRYGGEERCIQGKRSLGRPRCGWEDNIKIDHQEVGWGYGLD